MYHLTYICQIILDKITAKSTIFFSIYVIIKIICKIVFFNDIRYTGGYQNERFFSRQPCGCGKDKGIIVNTFDYIVVNIEGDYANLKRTDIESGELKLVARALLPEEIAEGTKLHYELMEYTVTE